MNTHTHQARNERVAMNLNLMQEDALIGLMYDEFHSNNMKHLDYDKVRRFAISIQCDPVVANRLDTEALTEDDAWSPPDAWITDMCLAFLSAEKEEKQKARDNAFGGERFEYDPKNPHARPPRGKTTGPQSPYNVRAKQLTTNRSKRSMNAFDSKSILASLP